MYARMDHLTGQPGHEQDGPDMAAPSAGVASLPGLYGSITFRQLAGPAAVFLTLWDTEDSATRFPGPRPGPAGLPGHIYEVAEVQQGPAVAQAPAYARLLYLDGPETPEQAAAADLAGRQRIWPAIRGLSGLASVYVLRRRDLGSVVITLATSIETLDAAERAVMSTELLPGEDPALLPGPDRIEIHHVTGYHVPTASPAAGGKGR